MLVMRWCLQVGDLCLGVVLLALIAVFGAGFGQGGSCEGAALLKHVGRGGGHALLPT